MLLLDTHALLWWASGAHECLSAKALESIDSQVQDASILVSAISTWEIAVLQQKGRIALALDVSAWLQTLRLVPRIKIIDVDSEIAVASAQLPGDFHTDPADRMIVATARRLGIPLITADEKIRAYPHVMTVW